MYICYLSYCYVHYSIITAIDLLRKYYDKFVDNLPAECLITLEKLLTLDIAITNEIFNYFVSCSNSRECNKQILYFLIESTKNNNQLLGFSFVMQLLTKEHDVTVLFRNG